MLLNEIRQASRLADAYHNQVIRDHGIRFDSTDIKSAPHTYADIKIAWLSERRYPVAADGSEFTIYDKPENNTRFRVVHDFYHHAYNQDLTAVSETELGVLHARLASEWAAANFIPAEQVRNLTLVLLADTVGQAAVHYLTGKFVVNQLAFVTMLLEACDLIQLCMYTDAATALSRVCEVISVNQPIQSLELQS